MKTKFGATVLAAAFLAALVIPWTVLAGGGGGGRGGGGGSKGGGGGSGRMGGESIGNRTQMQNQIGNREMKQFRTRDGEGDKDRDRDRDRDRIHKESGTEPAATATESAVSSTGEKPKKGHIYGPGDGTGYIAEGEDPPKDGTGYGAKGKQ